MSEGKPTTQQLTPQGKAWTFAIGALIGVVVFSLATNAAAIAYSSLAIGDISKPDQFTVGSWFRYDFGAYSPQPGQSFYVVTKIESITTAGDSVLGDPLVASKLGAGASWYNWSIKAYWMTGVEAKSLYGKNNTGNPLWDNGARFLFEGYAKRHTYSTADVNDQTMATSAAISRPQFVDMGFANNPSSMTFSNTSAGTSGQFEHRKLIAGIGMWSYSRSQSSPNQYYTAAYDPDSGLLLFIYANTVTGTLYSSMEWGITQYSAGVRYIPVTDPASVAVPDFSFVTGIDSSTGYIEFSKAQTYRAWKVTVESNDTSVVANMPQTRFVSDPIPINATSVGSAQINVTVIGDYFGVDSLPTMRSFIVTKAAPPADKVGATTITSSFVTSDAIHLGWNSVENASKYLVYANDTFIGMTGMTNFSFHPSVNGDYDIFIIVTSTVHAVSSDPSNIKTVNFAPSAVFSGEYAVPPPAEQPLDYMALILIVIVVVAGMVVSYILWKQGIIQKASVSIKSKSTARSSAKSAAKKAPTGGAQKRRV